MPETTQSQPIDPKQKRLIIGLLVSIITLVAAPWLFVFCMPLVISGIEYWYLGNPGALSGIQHTCVEAILSCGCFYWFVPFALNIVLLIAAYRQQKRTVLFVAIFFFFPVIVYSGFSWLLGMMIGHM